MKYTTPLLTLATLTLAAEVNPRAPQQAIIARNPNPAPVNVAPRQATATVTRTPNLGDLFSDDGVDDTASLRSKAGSFLAKATSEVGDIDTASLASKAGSLASKATSAVAGVFEDDGEDDTGKLRSKAGSAFDKATSVVGGAVGEATEAVGDALDGDDDESKAAGGVGGVGYMVVGLAGLVGVGVVLL